MMVDRSDAREVMKLATRIAANAYDPERGIEYELQLSSVLDHVEDAREAGGEEGLDGLRTALRVAISALGALVSCPALEVAGPAGLERAWRTITQEPLED